MKKVLSAAGALIALLAGNIVSVRAAEPCVPRDVYYNLEGTVSVKKMCFSNEFRASASLDGQRLEVLGFGKDGVRIVAVTTRAVEFQGGIYGCSGGKIGNGPLYVIWEKGTGNHLNNAGVYAACKEQKGKK